MKKLLLLTLLLLTFMLISGCGKDGVDGKAYISITWLFNPLYYQDNNLSTPTQVVNGRSYLTSEGRYNFSYTAWDGSSWIGWYSISINKGEVGKFLKRGQDGLDRNFELACYSIGPSIFEKSSYDLEFSKGVGKSPKSSENSMSKEKDLEKVPEYGLNVIEEIKGGYVIRIEYQRVK